LSKKQTLEALIGLVSAAIIAFVGWLHFSVEDLRKSCADLDKRVARLEYRVFGVITRSPTPAPAAAFPFDEDAGLQFASPAFSTLPSPLKRKTKEYLDEKPRP
jgi:hypothetical protein